MTLKVTHQQPYVSIAVFAWNEERAITGALESLLAQTIFAELAKRGHTVELLCVLNGCTDSTAMVAEEYLGCHGNSEGRNLQWRVADIRERGKLNAWNKFVHELSAPEAAYLILADADILIHEPRTLQSMLESLESNSEACISVDRPRKHLEFKSRRSPVDALSMKASGITRAAEAQLCAQLYCIRSTVARRIYLPRDLAACEDGFIKALVCTDFLDHQPNPARLVLAPNAEHTFEAYTSPAAVVKNQKRQVIGQTMVHILIDQELPKLSAAERSELAPILRRRDQTDPGWLKRLLADHLSRTPGFWRVCPTYLGTPFRRWMRLPWGRRFANLPAMAAGTILGFAGSYLAWRALKKGCTDYWPRAERVNVAPPAVKAPLSVSPDVLRH